MNKIYNMLKSIAPPGNWKLPVIITTGVLSGMLLLIFYVGNATSYLSDKPETCVNCHVMFPQYSSWQHSSHSRVATCNDCHVPHDNLISKYMFKASDGLRHSAMFTLRLEPQVIHIKDAGREVVEENCERCHDHLLGYYHSTGSGRENEDNEEEEVMCWSCHREVPHGKVSSLSSFPNARVPKLSPVLPDWLIKAIDKK